MAQIQQLTTSSFTIFEHQDANKTRNLVISVREPSIVLFMTPNCPYCHMFYPIYEKIAQNVPRFKFCILNADKYKNVAISSLTTTTPIKSVPYVIAYNNGKAVAIYSGPKKYDDVLDFIRELSKNIDKPKFNKSPTASGSTAHSSEKEDMKEFRTELGVPYNIVCGAGQCYLSYDQIYEGGSSDSVRQLLSQF